MSQGAYVMVGLMIFGCREHWPLLRTTAGVPFWLTYQGPVRRR